LRNPFFWEKTHHGVSRLGAPASRNTEAVR
jgi:hypothetical protein